VKMVVSVRRRRVVLAAMVPLVWYFYDVLGLTLDAGARDGCAV
jgi:hypothetical protein